MSEKRTPTETKNEFLSKIHQKIQNKYEEVQKKMHPSRSLESLNVVYESSSVTNASRISIQHQDEVEREMTKKVSQSSLIVKPVEYRDALYEDVELFFKEEEDYGSEYNVEVDSDDESVFLVQSESNELVVAEHNVDSVSLSSKAGSISNEEYEDISIDPEKPSSPSTNNKLSIIHKINQRISAARHKRRIEKEMNKNFSNIKKIHGEVEKFFLTNTTKPEFMVVKQKKVKVATLTIALLEATGLYDGNDDKQNKMIHCRFRLGTEKCKSKPVKSSSGKFVWSELFNMSVHDDDCAVEICLWDKDTALGRNVLDISTLEKERTVEKRIKMEELPNAQVLLLLTVTGSANENVLIDENDYSNYKSNFEQMRRQYVWYRISSRPVGHLSVIVFGAKGLVSPDCYCVLELANCRVQTHTEYKTHCPNWMKLFSFAVHDVTSVLELTIYDEKRAEEVGKVSIALLNIIDGKKKWYALKDSTQRERAKGDHPRILLEMKLTWNLIKASQRVINPKETKRLQEHNKLDRHLFARNLARIKVVVNWILGALVVLKTCFEWDSMKVNVVALVVWQVFCWYFRVWMLPLLFLIPFFWYRPSYHFNHWRKMRKKENFDNDMVVIESKDAKNEKEEKVSFRQKIQSLQDMVLYVQNAIGDVASFGESVKNLFNFTTPFLSGLAIFFIIVIAAVMYLIPVNYMFMAWSIHKFTRKILRPNRIPNNEILDLLSRVPDDETLLDCEEFPVPKDDEEEI